MANIFDQHAKRILDRACAHAGLGQTEAEVRPTGHRIDYFFEPFHDAPPADLTHLGLLGRLLSGPCTFEFFHKTPRPGLIRRCLSKHDFFQDTLRRQPRPFRTRPHQWIVSTDRPTEAIHRFRFEPNETLGPGFYSAPRGWDTDLIVLSELPDTRYTLLVRITGSGQVLERAVLQLLELPPDSPERPIALPAVVSLGDVLARKEGKRNKQEQEYYMAIYPSYEQVKERIEREARAVALADGFAHGLADGVARSIEHTYAFRFGPVPEAVSNTLRTTRDMALLDRWLELAVTGTREDLVAAILAPPGAPTPPAQPTPPNGKPAR